MSHNQVILFSFSIFIAALISGLKFKNISDDYYPFIFCTWIASLNEIISLVMSRNHVGTAFNNNLYILMEALLITWQFRRWGMFVKSRTTFYMTGIGLTCIWLIEYSFIGLKSNLFYFGFVYCMIIVLLSIQKCIRLIISYQGSLLKDPRFIICSGFIIFFTFRILIDGFWLAGLNASKAFRNEVFIAMAWINLFVNLLFCIAFLWIPKKPQYIFI